MPLDLSTFTFIHTALSLVALASGIIVLIGLLSSRSNDLWTAVYLVTAVATSVTGFGFPFEKFLPSHAVGIVSLILLAAVIVARYVFRLAGAWRWIYAVGIAITVYLDAFVGVVQAFLKFPALNALAPTGSEPPFAFAQGAVLIVFIALAIAAALKFRPAAAA